MSNLVIIFVRNVQIGKVKTRLAKTIGDDKALQVYIHMLDHVADVVQQTNAHKAVFYSNYIEEVDEFMVPVFQKYIQLGSHRGERMANAFIKGFSRNFKKILLISPDYYGLDPTILKNAFEVLETQDVVLGPAVNGNCYLMGLKQYHKKLFGDREWNGDNVIVDLILDLKNEELSYHLLPALQGVEEEKDLPPALKRIMYE